MTDNSLTFNSLSQIESNSFEIGVIEPPTMLEADVYSKHMAMQQTNEELDKAAEIYISTNFTVIHYSELMNDVTDGLATKQMFISWLNDNTRNGEVMRKGILSLYPMQNSHEFTKGKWNPRYFVSLIKFAFTKLIDLDFVKERKKVEMFKKSIEDKSWREQAIGVIGLKMLEFLFEKKALITDAANNIIGSNYNYRKVIDSLAKINGRVAKNPNAQPTAMNDIRYEIESHFKKQSTFFRERSIHSDEYKIFLKHKEAIEFGIDKVKRQLELGDGR